MDLTGAPVGLTGAPVGITRAPLPHVIIHGPGKNSSLCLAVAASVQKYIRATKRFHLYE